MDNDQKLIWENYHSNLLEESTSAQRFAAGVGEYMETLAGTGEEYDAQALLNKVFDQVPLTDTDLAEAKQIFENDFTNLDSEWMHWEVEQIRNWFESKQGVAKEALATDPTNDPEFASLGVVDKFATDENLLRYVGVLILTDPEFSDVRAKVIARQDIQNRIKDRVDDN